MLITLIEKEKIYTKSLPLKVNGQFWVTHSTPSGEEENIISIEGVNNQWIIKSNKRASLIDANDNLIKSVELKPLSFYSVYMQKTNEKVLIFTEPITEERQTFEKFLVSNKTVLKIGREEGNDIIFSSKFVSSSHAVLTFSDNTWEIEDKGSTNGTFVNNFRIARQRLSIGDVIYILGFKIIIGNCFIAINKPDNRIRVNNSLLHQWEGQLVESFDDDDDRDTPTNTNCFYRSPRFKRDIEKATFTIDPPPQANFNDEVPLLLMLGPSVTMGMASMTTGIFAINNALQNGNISQALPTVVMSFSMLLGTVLWPIISKRFEKLRKRKREALRQEKYKEYLQNMSNLIDAECLHQSEILNENHIQIEECIERIRATKRNLWERTIGQDDFLTIRLGLGDMQLNAELKYNERKFTIDKDNLQDELLEFCEKPKILKKVPVTVSFNEDYISGVIGDRGEMLSFAKGMIIQLSALHSYDELKFVFIYDEAENDEFEFVKWLPHTWNDERTIRFIASNTNDVKEISAYLGKQIDNRTELNETDLSDISTHYIIFALSKSLSVRSEMIKQILTIKKNIGFSLVAFYDVINNLPKECTAVIELAYQNSKIFDRNDISGKFICFNPDIHINKESEELAIKLSNTQLDVLAGAFQLPTMLTFLELFGVGKIEHLNCTTRWKENDPTKTLEAEVGIDTLGEKFKLDLHEKFHGPHGLVAGMTGSGKSEFIIAYILSMAVNYHPNEVAFILIDYKGGGMAKSFENLPHTVGVITNLDGAAVKRSLVSIQSELKRRQAIFNDAGKKVGISNIDIYKYQKLYREGSVIEPLQHLFIISDEFAELKTQQPEFMEQLVSAARIGRSLGVHLILATQKPSGVVDDQIWSNSKFRVCLKVQEKADSMDMLKRPDAAELTQTGRFYLQVGYNELFELGQSAWAGAPYYPSDKVLVEKDNSVVVIDKIGRIIKSAKIDKRKNYSPNPKKQLDSITEYLCQVADEEKIKVRPLWLPPIEAIILTSELKTKYKYAKCDYFLNPIIGEYDDPARQQQCLMTVPLSEDGNVIVYGIAGSGKTTFLTTMLYSLMEEHSPNELNVYILDFASETLRAFSKSPHIGDVILSYEAEKVSNLFKMLRDEMDKRKKLFADFGGDYKSYISESGKTLPSIVIAINNFSAFIETYEEKEEAVAFLTREGTKYGIYFVVTAISTGAVRFRLQQNFKQLFVLQMNDDTEYSTILGKTDGLLPSKIKGRGLLKTDGIYEFQTAHITKKTVPFSFIQEYCKQQQERWSGNVAKKIPILPEVVDIQFLSNYIMDEKSLNLPIGVEKNTLNVHYYPFGESYISMLLSSGDEYKEALFNIAEMFSLKCGLDVTLFDTPQSYIQDDETFNYISQLSNCETFINTFFGVLVERNNLSKEKAEKGEKVPDFDQKVIIINSLANLKEKLSNQLSEKLDLILEKGDSKYNVCIIIGDSSKNLSNYSYDKWFKKHFSTTDGIWIGNGITEQYQLKATKNTDEMHQEMPSNFAFSLQKGKPVKIKTFEIEKGD